MFDQFEQRNYSLERIDTGDYTAEEYEQFLADIRLVNRFAGDNWALRKTLFRDIERQDIRGFSLLDVGAGSGELLRTCANFAKKTKRDAKLVGLELNERSARAILEESLDYKEIIAVRADALNMPFADNSFDYVICSLFTHHFREAEIFAILNKMSRIARRKIYVIDLHRHPFAYGLYKIFCLVFVKGCLVKEDGCLSILRGFRPSELEMIAASSGLRSSQVNRRFPFRLTLEATGK